MRRKSDTDLISIKFCAPRPSYIPRTARMATDDATRHDLADLHLGDDDDPLAPPSDHAARAPEAAA